MKNPLLTSNTYDQLPRFWTEIFQGIGRPGDPHDGESRAGDEAKDEVDIVVWHQTSQDHSRSDDATTEEDGVPPAKPIPNMAANQ